MNIPNFDVKEINLCRAMLKGVKTIVLFTRDREREKVKLVGGGVKTLKNSNSFLSAWKKRVNEKCVLSETACSRKLDSIFRTVLIYLLFCFPCGFRTAFNSAPNHVAQ